MYIKTTKLIVWNVPIKYKCPYMFIYELFLTTIKLLLKTESLDDAILELWLA